MGGGAVSEHALTQALLFAGSQAAMHATREAQAGSAAHACCSSQHVSSSASSQEGGDCGPNNVTPHVGGGPASFGFGTHVGTPRRTAISSGPHAAQQRLLPSMTPYSPTAAHSPFSLRPTSGGGHSLEVDDGDREPSAGGDVGVESFFASFEVVLSPPPVHDAATAQVASATRRRRAWEACRVLIAAPLSKKNATAGKTEGHGLVRRARDARV